MKKIFTLLFSTAIISSAFAQDDHRDWNNRDHDGYREHHYDRRYDDNIFLFIRITGFGSVSGMK